MTQLVDGDVVPIGEVPAGQVVSNGDFFHGKYLPYWGQDRTGFAGVVQGPVRERRNKEKFGYIRIVVLDPGGSPLDPENRPEYKRAVTLLIPPDVRVMFHQQ